MRFIFSFLICILISISTRADYTLAVFGDSLSSGYKLSPNESFYAQLEQSLREKGYAVNVLNASKAGETTIGGLKKIDHLLIQKPNAVILELGINDSLKNVPIQTIKKNLKHLIDTFQSNHIPVLLVGMKTTPQKNIEYQKQFENMYRDLAKEYNLDFYPFFMDGIFDSKNIWDPKIQNENLIPNDLHPNGKGITIMVQGILPTVERFLKKQKIFPRMLSNSKFR